MQNIKRYLYPPIDDKVVGDTHLFGENLHPLLQRIYAVRGIKTQQDCDYNLKHLLPFSQLRGITEAVHFLYNSLLQQQKILIIGDFDVDGATSTALAMLALRSLGFMHVTYLVPNRFEFGYGLTPEIVKAAAQQTPRPDVIITVDNGIASNDAVLLANELGIKVIITDHHLPASEQLPAAVAIVNPNQYEDLFPSKNLAGVGVTFYLILALRAYLRDQQWFSQKNIAEPNMAQFLDLVALGTVADLVPLDHNNRILVQHGLERIKSGKCRLGLKMLLRLAGRDYEKIKVDDLVYTVAPRLNAAGRLDDMSLGVACLLSDGVEHVRALARELDGLNQERRTIEAGMQQQAMQALAQCQFAQQELPPALCVFNESWHQGVIGILASKLKERFHCPVAAFAQVSEEEIKGSLRSIEGLHIHDVLGNIAKKKPGLIVKFGGHAMAAGMSLRKADYPTFNNAFIDEVKEQLQTKALEHFVYTDGELPAEYFVLATAELLHAAGPWGQGFPEPLFDGIFDLVAQRVVGEKHLKMTLRLPETKQEIDAIYFNINTNIWPNFRADKVQAVYRLDVNEYNGRRSLQLMIKWMEPYSVV